MPESARQPLQRPTGRPPEATSRTANMRGGTLLVRVCRRMAASQTIRHIHLGYNRPCGVEGGTAVGFVHRDPYLTVRALLKTPDFAPLEGWRGGYRGRLTFSQPQPPSLGCVPNITTCETAFPSLSRPCTALGASKRAPVQLFLHS
jgi:hypothetical protein